MAKVRLLCAAIVAFCGFAALPVLAAQSVPPKAAADACAAATARAEKAHGIPKHLLTAISHAESGRWSTEREATQAWPWTVMADGRGRYFTTKEEAVAEVEILLSEGVKNIDVGCMQVNLHYHWEAFETLSEAFDPEANAAYAARFLKERRAEARNWLTAAGHYHSKTREKMRPYRTKVIKFWRALKKNRRVRSTNPRLLPKKNRDNVAETSVDGAQKAKKERPAQVDHARTDRFNNRFKKAVAFGRGDRTAASREERAAVDLARWRDIRHQRAQLAHESARRRAEADFRRQQRLVQFDDVKREDSFAERRRRQLQRWRQGGNVRSKNAPN